MKMKNIQRIKVQYQDYKKVL